MALAGETRPEAARLCATVAEGECYAGLTGTSQLGTASARYTETLRCSMETATQQDLVEQALAAAQAEVAQRPTLVHGETEESPAENVSPRQEDEYATEEGPESATGNISSGTVPEAPSIPLPAPIHLEPSDWLTTMQMMTRAMSQMPSQPRSNEDKQILKDILQTLVVIGNAAVQIATQHAPLVAPPTAPDIQKATSVDIWEASDVYDALKKAVSDLSGRHLLEGNPFPAADFLFQELCKYCEERAELKIFASMGTKNHLLQHAWKEKGPGQRSLHEEYRRLMRYKHDSKRLHTGRCFVVSLGVKVPVQTPHKDLSEEQNNTLREHHTRADEYLINLKGALKKTERTSHRFIFSHMQCVKRTKYTY